MSRGVISLNYPLTLAPHTFLPLVEREEYIRGVPEELRRVQHR